MEDYVNKFTIHHSVTSFFSISIINLVSLILQRSIYTKKRTKQINVETFSFGFFHKMYKAERNRQVIPDLFHLLNHFLLAFIRISYFIYYVIY
ncbi:hypothetical protein LEYRA_37 [Paenibacillus phage Leyra]|uniref:Uncharacterized protein n=6 Tax=Fernvirus TaxID=2843380 RepID=A0A0C5AC13_9CAUD|nr:hypothetical protein AVV26_gp27 [Paenibacillus phage HB10c2]YP_009224893.1 hypothetical protein AXJ12_gp27 [Paenibacillus phage Rani]YP_009836581.1 hypothetical protein HWB47_gp37 [Paenibacillus phage Leyra]YP_009838864.1 hypothetical protein HWB73_gp28 [Paenibacillus phage Eltigre]AJK27886.1 hypothetical protein REDBUD_27 [Bacteriophage Redbud]AUS03650.1 hypothetical protein KIEL007_28 [Paenibacillus phage Kiel007]QVV19369.1 hypothetical protein AlexiD_27 [Paenibacillus phage AlexiD]QVV1